MKQTEPRSDVTADNIEPADHPLLNAPRVAEPSQASTPSSATPNKVPLGKAAPRQAGGKHRADSAGSSTQASAPAQATQTQASASGRANAAQASVPTRANPTQPKAKIPAPAKNIKPARVPKLGEPAVVLDRVSVTYTSKIDRGVTPHRNQFTRALDRMIPGGRKQRVHAVKDVSLVVYSGESVGLIGVNGAGKSTVLRTIAGVESPTTGVVLTRSQPQLQAVAAAVIPTISGLQNIRIGGLAMGMSPQELAEAEPRIIELAGIGKAIHRPMNTYSAGMRTRLLFAINTACRPEILLIDEALGTGDRTFAARANKMMEEMLEASGTIFLVSHSQRSIRKICTRVVWMHHGQVIADGPTADITKIYDDWAKAQSQGKTELASQMLDEVISSYRPVAIEFTKGH